MPAISISGLNTLSTTGTLTQICGQPLTQCFDAKNDPPTAGVTFIRGFSGSSGQQPNEPQLRAVELFPGNCGGNAYFQEITGGCSLTLEALVDSRLLNGNDARTNIVARGAGCPSQGCALSKDIVVPESAECTIVKAASATTGQCWRGSIPVAPN